MSQEFDCNYGEEEFSTIKAGIEAIEAVLAGNDIHAKERLLYCLDWYMDPYYQKDLSEIQEPLIELLQKIAVSDEQKDLMKYWKEIWTVYLKSINRRHYI